uniref:Integrase catalytic domain-containing protein n=1 Tax=Onchocerca volvulus TaxID=6282 RepID=A0A8R1XY72_ONCVO
MENELALMALLDPASISLGEEEDEEEEEEIQDAGCIPAVGASVVIDEQDGSTDQAASIKNDQIARDSSSGTNNSRNFPNESTSLRFAQPHFMYQVIPKTNHLKVDQITDSIYSDFIILMTGGEVIPPAEEHRQILDAMVQGDDYTVACDVDDEFLGHLDYVIVHLPSIRLLLTSEQREQVIESAMARFKNDKHPIGACLQLLQKNYIGFPSIIRLRNALMDCLSRLMTAGEDDVDYAVSSLDDAGTQSFTGEDMSNDSVLPETTSDSDFAVRKKGMTQNLLHTAIPDNEYDILAQILTRKVKIDDVENVVLRETIKARMKGGLLVGEYWSEPNEFLSPGWRIRLRDSGKIIPRISEIDDIWRRCYETMPDCTQKQMLTYLEERYVGISLKTKQRAATKDILLKGSRVQFPSRPRCIGSKPMQYVQIDMVEMECSEYGDRCYTMALIVTDLYSHFVFGRALAEAPDTSLLVRHLMDIFGAFAPPEAYRTYTNDEVIGLVMSDIEKLFKIEIKNIGHGVMNHSNLCASMYKRAAEELGGRERWVEALPFAVIDYNQTPVQCFGDLRISPFEIMFGRRPWRNHSIPPWVRSGLYGENGNEVEGYIEGNHMGNTSGATEMCMIRSTPLPRRPEVEERLANVYLSEVSSNRAKISCVLGRYPAKFNDTGHVIDPGTGYLYEVGDCVYLRNSVQEEMYADRPKKRQNESRYYRASIIEVDYQNPDFMYKVCYWDDIIDVDHLPPDQWPGEGSLSAWVSPYDIAPSTADLARRRNVVRRRELEFQCKCGYDFCELVYNQNCPYKLSQACCQRLKMNCPYHSRLKVPPREISMSRPKNSTAPVLKLAANGERRLLTIPRRMKSEVDHSSSRWIFQGGRYIELFPSSSNTTSIVGREDQQSNVHFDYDVEAFSSKKRRIQVQYGNACYSNFVYDGNPVVSRLPVERSYGYQAVELYEPKDNLMISNTHELEGLDVDDESIDVASNGQSASPEVVSDQSVFLTRGDSKTMAEAGSGKISKIQQNPLQAKVLSMRSTKRISAPPQRLSPT